MKNIKFETKWAIIFAFMTLLWMVLERSVGLHDTHIDKHAIYTNFIAIPAISVYVFALLDKRKNFYHGKMTYSQGFICGLIITLFVTVLSPLTQYITSTFITPYYFENAIAYGVSTGKITPEAAEDYFNLENYIIQGLIGAPFMGLITTALVAIFIRKK
ncbi:DUF4199 domain-containing protein [Cognataquiflexum rubidum]|uniref:DUF4199 domain-containing protein n=1 Tax=Cognataquiflexum rubidum TaxID=2922273 RepID=UPI001F1333AA|nr:DUF4199 domain-containing protein [Cognataquiflexum rubidum]MCH6234986.1 DUF4199 domain-containing protein [Cognataquiflexum rubidum]